MLDVEQPQPALLPERQTDHAADLDQLGLAEVPVQAVPKRVVCVEMPDDRFGIGDTAFCLSVKRLDFSKFKQVEDVVLDLGAACRSAFTER